ncbi:Protein of unknown function (DUF1016) [Thiocystis violascens DSM 198]|uniref:YhcG N-terminal domain-containing protein n=1 Tax=Thiocystis violascens (strain ATCC 17096 / DSM 198 / 6111) TaxID=765911 RepID=I3YEE4_THIV6|nr:Protein of unknown function (DUF1016) [Thiocystis violascens DSM 198]
MPATSHRAAPFRNRYHHSRSRRRCDDSHLGTDVQPDSVMTHSEAHYAGLQGDIIRLLESARRSAARSVNALMTASYWEIGRRIVEFEQGGTERAEYGEALIQRLALDLTGRFWRGFSRQNLQQMRAFYLTLPLDDICQTLSGKSSPAQTFETSSATSSAPQIRQTASGESQATQGVQTTPAPSPDHRPQDRQVQLRGRRPDAPLSERCPRALDEAR